MKIYEILSLNKEFLYRLSLAGIKTEDYQYVGLFQKYKEMIAKGDKVTYIVAALAEKYNISERKVYAIIQHFKQEISII